MTIDVQANEWYIIQAGSGTPDDTGIFHLMIFGLSISIIGLVIILNVS